MTEWRFIMQISLIKNKKKKTIWIKAAINSLLIMITLLLISGCARWPNGGDGDERKLLLIRVDINENGQINTNLGKYYIVFDTRAGAFQPPSYDREEWKDEYYYIMLDNMGFCFGQWGSSCQYASIGIKGEQYFQINLDLDSLGNPKKIFMNVITVDGNGEKYDYIGNPSDLTIDTSIVNFNKVIQDFLGDSSGGPDFDIFKVTITLVS